jgi:hypothetical protein
MVTLAEMLAKQREERMKGKVNAASIPPVQTKTVPTASQETRQEIQPVPNKGNGAAQSGNGSVGGQESSPVPSAGLSLRERLALKAKQNEPRTQPETNREATEQITGVSVLAKNDENSIQPAERHTNTSGGTADIETLRRNLAYLANNIDQVELVGQVVRTIAVQLKNSPELTPYMKNEDVDLVVRGLRRAYNIAARKRVENKEKKSKKDELTDELSQAFAAAGLKLS